MKTNIFNTENKFLFAIKMCEKYGSKAVAILVVKDIMLFMNVHSSDYNDMYYTLALLEGNYKHLLINSDMLIGLRNKLNEIE